MFRLSRVYAESLFWTNERRGNTIRYTRLSNSNISQKMHYVTLEQIDQYIARKAHARKHQFAWHIAKEACQFGVIFVGVFLFSTIAVNANLFYHTMKNMITPVEAQEIGAAFAGLTPSVEQADNGDAENDQTLFLQQQVQASLENSTVLPDHTETMSSYLSAKMKASVFQFNTLPPENRIIIPAIGVNAPIVDVSVTTEQKIRHGDFDTELYSGVVKYPSTPEPGITGNALLFGHTSYYWWKNNPYAEVFAKLPALQEGDMIQTLWHGQYAEFEVIAKIVVHPSKVDDTYLQYT